MSAPSGILSSKPPYTPGIGTGPPLRAAGTPHGAPLAARVNALPKHHRPVRFHHHRLLHAIVCAGDPRHMRLHTHSVDTRVGADASGHLHQLFVNVGILVVDRFRPALRARHAQPKSGAETINYEDT